MTNYSIDSTIRRTVTICIILMSLALVVPINMILSWLYNLIVDWFPTMKDNFDFLFERGIVSGISLFGVFGILHGIFSNYIWKWGIIVNITKIPNLNGVWEGKLISSYKDPTTNEQIEPIDMWLEITQTWDNINIKAHFPESNSYSKTASLYVNNGKGIVLGFSYKNDSLKVDINDQESSGYNELTYEDNKLVGNYFSNKKEGTRGTIKLKKVKKGAKISFAPFF